MYEKLTKLLKRKALIVSRTQNVFVQSCTCILNNNRTFFIGQTFSFYRDVSFPSDGHQKDM